MNRERLALMAKLLFEVATNTWKGGPQVAVWNKEFDFKKDRKVKFNLDDWITHRYRNKPRDCGTVACAVGHACLDPRFNAMGLTINIDDKRPLFGGLSNWPAVQKFFDIEEETAEMLFQEYSYEGRDVNPSQVLERIVMLLEKGERKFMESME